MNNQKIFKFKKPLFLFVFFLFFGFLLFRKVFFSHGLISGLDWPIPPQKEQTIHWFLNSIYTWNDNYVFSGQPQQFLSIQLIPLIGFLAFFSFLGADGELLSRLLLVIFYFGGGFSFFYLLKYFKLNFRACFIGTLFYLLTPFSIDWILIGGIGEFLGLYAFFPLSFLFFLKSTSENKNNFLWLSLALATTIFYPLFSIILQSVLFISYSIFDIITGDKKKIKIYFHFFFFYYLFFLGINSYWILLAVFNPKNVVGGVNFKLSIGEYFIFNDNFRLWSKLAPFFENTINWGDRLFRVLRRTLSFGIPILSFSSLIINRKNKHAVYFASLILGLIGFVNFPPVYYLIENNILFFGMFRHINKFYPIIALSFAYLIALLIDRGSYLNDFLSRKKTNKWLLSALVIFWLVSYFPFFRTGNFIEFLRLVVYPADYSEIGNLISKENKNLWLPTGSGYVMPEDRKDGSWVSDHFANHSVNSGGINEINYRFKYVAELWLNNLMYKSTTPYFINLGKILAVFNVENLILRNKEEITQWAIPMWGDIWSRRTIDLKENLKKQKDISLESTMGVIDVYKNEVESDLIYKASKRSIVSGGLNVFTPLSWLEGFNFNENVLSFSGNNEGDKLASLPSDNLIIENNNILDLVFSFVPQEYKIQPGVFIDSQESVSKWTDLHQVVWWYRNSYQANFSRSAFTQGGKAKLQNIPFKLKQDGRYMVFLNGFQGMVNGEVGMVMNDNINFSRYFKAEFNNEKEESFIWKQVGEADLKGGNYFLSLITKNESVISNIVIVPKIIFESAYRKTKEIINKTKIVLENEFWDYSGEVNFDVPKSADYKLIIFPGISSNLLLDGKTEVNLLNPIKLEEGMHTLSFDPPKKDNTIENSSFEKKEENISDISVDTHSGLKQFPLVNSSLSDDATDGNYSLQISAFGYTTSILKNINNFSPDYTYKISFDYKNIKGVPLKYTILQSREDMDLDRQLSGERSQEVIHWPTEELKKENFWQRHQRLVSFMPSIKKTNIMFSFEPWEETINLLDNLEIIPVKKYFLTLKEIPVDKPLSVHESIPLLNSNDIKKINPAKYSFILEKDSDSGFIVFSETFDPQWKIYSFPPESKETFWETWFKKPLDENRHFNSQGYANGWLFLPEDFGDSKINRFVIEYWPQRIVWIGLAVSGSICLIIVCINILILYKNKKLNDKNI